MNAERGGRKKNIHATVKPLALMSYLITLGSQPNDIVLDPFCGSGVTIEAAIEMKRNFIGNDIDNRFFDIQTNKYFDMFLF